MEIAASQHSDKNAASSASTSRFARRPMLAFGVLIAVNAMWAFQFPVHGSQPANWVPYS